MSLSPTQVALLAALLLVFGYVWRLSGSDSWRAHLTNRFVYGVPWGTVLTVVGLVAVYLFVQSGLESWSDPVVLPFRSWSYFYPTGMLAASFTHAGPGHLVSNLSGTVAFGVLAEYAWGHYPPGSGSSGAADGRFAADGGQSSRGILGRLWIRALVIFPAAVIVVSLFTSVLAFGFSLGFSGTVFALAGFCLVVAPARAIVATLAIPALSTLYEALAEPVRRTTVAAGPPSPPEWAAVNLQAHLLGLLVGVLLAVGLHWRRRDRPDAPRVFGAALLFAIAQQLWAITASGDGDAYLQYRGAGVVFVLGLVVVIAIAVEDSSDRGSDRSFAARPVADLAKLTAALWLALLGLVALFVLVTAAVGEIGLLAAGIWLFVALSLALPAVSTLAPGGVLAGLTSRRRTALSILFSLTVLVATVSVPFNVYVVPADQSTPAAGAVSVGGYDVFYGDNVTDPRIAGVEALEWEGLWDNETGLIVRNPDRQIYTAAVEPRRLAYAGNATLQLGGPGWREPVQVRRTGWAVSGNESAYAVDLRHDGEATQAFTSEPVRAHARIANHSLWIVPRSDGFALRAARNDETVGTVSIPSSGNATELGPLRVETTPIADTPTVFVSSGGSRAMVAERESG